MKTRKGIKNRYKFMKIRTKIMLFYTVLILASLGISMVIYTKLSNDYSEQIIVDLSMKNIEAQNRSLELLVDDISNYSKEIISNQNTQGILGGGDELNLELKKLDRELAASVIFNPKISSTYVFDFEGKRYFRDKRRFKEIDLELLQSQLWYEDIESLIGGYYININAGGLINDSEANYLTLFRIINSNEDHQPIGVMMVCIEEFVVMDVLNLSDDAGIVIKLKDKTSENQMSLSTTEVNYYENILKDNTEDVFFDYMTLEGENYRVTGYNNSDYEWQLLHFEPNIERTEMTSKFNVVFITILVLIGVTIFYGSVYISKYISNPIVELTKVMKAAEKGDFKEVEIHSRYDEIGSLNSGYNFMVNHIKELIDEIIAEHEVVKNAELRIVMEQIKPHFMYNTLDSISSLIMLNKNDEAYASLSALGKFYRASLSNGNFIIDLETEIEIVKNYLFIQKIRYKDLFEVVYDIDESLLNLRVPKLVMQPLVENSIYHGIRPIGSEGIICISVSRKERYIELAVIDNGCGMSNEVREQILNNTRITKGQDKSSVGLPATINRVKKMYGESSELLIDSTSQGTTIVIRIKEIADVE